MKPVLTPNRSPMACLPSRSSLSRSPLSVNNWTRLRSSGLALSAAQVAQHQKDSVMKPELNSSSINYHNSSPRCNWMSARTSRRGKSAKSISSWSTRQSTTWRSPCSTLTRWLSAMQVSLTPRCCWPTRALNWCNAMTPYTLICRSRRIHQVLLCQRRVIRWCECSYSINGDVKAIEEVRVPVIVNLHKPAQVRHNESQKIELRATTIIGLGKLQAA